MPRKMGFFERLRYKELRPLKVRLDELMVDTGKKAA